MFIRTAHATYPTFLRAPDDGGTGGTATAPAAGDAAAAAAAAAAGGTGDQAAGGGDEGGLFDLAEGDTPPPDKDGKAQRPAYIPEKYWDAETGTAKVEDLAKANHELRTLIAKGSQKPPATADGYTVPAVEGVADPLAALGGKDDPLWGEVRTAAHGAGISQAQMAAILGPVLAAAAAKAAGGGDAPPADPAAAAEARQEAQRAELAKLGPNGRAVVAQTGAWVKGLEGRGILTADEAKALRGISTAEGVRALAKLRSLNGEAPIPVDAFAADGSMTAGDAKRMMQEGFATNDMTKVEKARAALTKLEKAGAL